MARLLVDMVFKHNRPSTKRSKSVFSIELVIECYSGTDDHQAA